MIKTISIGSIPVDSKSQVIYCGDSETSHTIEINFKIVNQKIVGLDNDFSFSFQGDFITPNSDHLKELSNYISSYGLKISPNQIYNGLILLRDEKDFFSQKFRLVESVGGTFNNKDFVYNGKIYLRMYLEKDNEILRESICVKVM